MNEQKKHEASCFFILLDLRACVEIVVARGAWRDVSCGEYRPFICKRKMGKETNEYHVLNVLKKVPVGVHRIKDNAS